MRADIDPERLEQMVRELNGQNGNPTRTPRRRA